jgi:hypothetical protein
MTDDLESQFDIGAEFAELTSSMRGGYAFLAPDLDDMAVVILATSLIDEYLKFSLLLAFNSVSVSRALVQSVFTGNGPLSTFSARINVCAALGLLNVQMRHDLNILRKVRNDFAHSMKPLRLSAMNRCLSLRIGHDQVTEAESEEKRRFIQSSRRIVGMLASGAVVTLARHTVLMKHRDEVLAEAQATLDTLYAGRDPASDR